MKLFLDESGNSGSDIYDPQQPVLAYGGVWLDEADEQYFGSFVTTLRSKHRLQGTGELKGRTLLKTDAGRRAISDVLKELHSRVVPLALLAVHKPFMAAGVLVDDCTDYAYNPAFSEQWTWDNELIEPLVAKIMAASVDDQLMKAWRARRGDDRELFKVEYASLLFALSLNQDPQLAELATKMKRADLDDLWECSTSSREQRGGGYSPNLSAFGALMQCCDEQAEKIGADDVAIVHDNQSQYQEVFTKWWAASRAADPFRFRYPSGNVMKLPLERLTSLSFTDSTTEVGIQLADIIASALRIVVQERTTGSGVRGNEFITDIKVHVAARDRMGGFPFVIGPERWQYDMMDALGMMELLRSGALGQ